MNVYPYLFRLKVLRLCAMLLHSTYKISSRDILTLFTTYHIKLIESKNVLCETVTIKPLGPTQSCAVLVTFHVISLLCLRISNEKESLYL